MASCLVLSSEASSSSYSQVAGRAPRGPAGVETLKLCSGFCALVSLWSCRVLLCARSSPIDVTPSQRSIKFVSIESEKPPIYKTVSSTKPALTGGKGECGSRDRHICTSLLRGMDRARSLSISRLIPLIFLSTLTTLTKSFHAPHLRPSPPWTHQHHHVFHPLRLQQCVVVVLCTLSVVRWIASSSAPISDPPTFPLPLLFTSTDRPRSRRG